MLIIKPESNATSSSRENLFLNRDAKNIEEQLVDSLHGWGKQEGHTVHR